MIEGRAAWRDVDLVGSGVAVVPAGGKGNLDRVHVVFKGFGIPTYLIFDADGNDPSHRDQQARLNRILLSLAGGDPDDFPATQCQARFTVFSNELEDELRTVAGADWERLLGQCSEAAGLPLGRDVLKTSYGCREFMNRVGDRLGPETVFGKLLDRIGEL